MQPIRIIFQNASVYTYGRLLMHHLSSLYRKGNRLKSFITPLTSKRFRLLQTVSEGCYI